MKKISIYFLLSALLCSTVAFSQQQTLFTNVMLNPYLYNPAYAGSFKGQQYFAGYRNQWTGFTGAPVTMMAGGYGTLKKKPMMAVGGLVQSDKIGLIQRTSVYGSYSYHVKINKTTNLGLGISMGGVQYNFKAYDGKPYDKDDPFMQVDILNALALDGNAGLYLQGKNYFFGLSSMQLLKTKIHWEDKNGRLTQHVYVYTGYNFILDKKKEWMVTPMLMFRANTPAPAQLESNLKVTYKDMVWLGGSYRHTLTKNPNLKGKNSLCVLVGTTISKQFTFGYGYDYALSAMQNYSSGSHEIFLSYTMQAKKRKTASERILDADESEFNNIDNSMKSNLKNKKKDESKKTPEKLEDIKKNEEAQPQQPEVKTETPKEEVKTDTPAEPNKQEGETKKEEPVKEEPKK